MQNRLSKLRTLMEKQKLDAVFISSLSNIRYLTGFFGFSTEDRDAFLLITKKTQFIFTHGIYKEAVLRNVKTFKLVNIMREKPITQSLTDLITRQKIKKIGFEAFDLKVLEYQRITKFIDKNIFEPVDLVGKMRTIKTTEEIQAIENASAIGDKAFSHVLKYFKKGITEKEVAFELESLIKKNGGVLSFSSVVAFGKNAAFIHHQTGTRKLKQNEYILLDFGVKLNNYCSDMTRTIFFGKASEKQKEIYQTVFDSQKIVIEYIQGRLDKKEKIQGTIADKIAREYLIAEGFADLPYSLGHGIGLEVHEAPRLTPSYNDLLENGMVFSIEPGIYLPDKFGIRIEDLFAIENNKLIQLTHSPKKLIEI